MRHRLLLLTLLPALALWPWRAAASNHAAPADDIAVCPAGSTSHSATLTIQVQYAYPGGAPPPPGVPAPPIARSPAPGVQVVAVPAGDGAATPVAMATTDDEGQAVIDLLPGSYWVFVPAPSPTEAGPAGAGVLYRMPDDTIVLGWVEIDLGPDADEAVTIVIDVATA